MSENEPTVKRMSEMARTTPDPVLNAARLRELCLAAGADGSAAEEHVTRRFPNKTPKAVTNGFPDEVNVLLDQIGPRPRRTRGV